MRKADWYFDFLSPFAYLQNCRLDKFTANLSINRKPLLLAGLLNHWGTKGPAEISSKRLFSYRHVQWMADQLDLPLCFPKKHPFNPISLLRLCIAADCSKKAVDAIFNCVWVKGLSGEDPGNWPIFCEAVNIKKSKATQKISSTEIKQKLKLNGQEALEQGVFGVPTLVVDGNLFWGLDSTDMAIEYISNSQLFGSSEMKRLETLPGY